MSSKISVAIADSQVLTAEGMRSLLHETGKYQVVSMIHSKDELFSFLKKESPAVLVIDASTLENLLPIHIEQLTEMFSPAQILIVTASVQRDFTLRILETGITHYLLKSCSADEIMQALLSIESRTRYLCKEVVDLLLSEKTASDRMEATPLTKKEIEIIKLIAGGLTNKEIASKGFLSIHTVNTHRKNILKKLNINNTSELIMYAVKNGIIDTTEYYI